MQHLQIVSLLLEAGADPNLINFRLYNPFTEAARIGSTAYVTTHPKQNEILTFEPNMINPRRMRGGYVSHRVCLSVCPRASCYMPRL